MYLYKIDSFDSIGAVNAIAIGLDEDSELKNCYIEKIIVKGHNEIVPSTTFNCQRLVIISYVLKHLFTAYFNCRIISDSLIKHSNSKTGLKLFRNIENGRSFASKVCVFYITKS